VSLPSKVNSQKPTYTSFLTPSVAIYTRVSTKDQTTENQLPELHAWAARAGHAVAKVYDDIGISGAKGREQRSQVRRHAQGRRATRIRHASGLVI